MLQRERTEAKKVAADTALYLEALARSRVELMRYRGREYDKCEYCGRVLSPVAPGAMVCRDCAAIEAEIMRGGVGVETHFVPHAHGPKRRAG